MSLDRRSFLKILAGGVLTAAGEAGAKGHPPDTESQMRQTPTTPPAPDSNELIAISPEFQRWLDLQSWIEQSPERIGLITDKLIVLGEGNGNNYAKALHSALDAFAQEKSDQHLDPVAEIEDSFDELRDKVIQNTLSPLDKDKENKETVLVELLELFRTNAQLWLMMKNRNVPQQ